jgi:5-methylcytosine-specific restriction protein A
MPYKPLKPCNYRYEPCAKLIPPDERFCDRHKTADSRDRAQIHGTSYDRGYDNEWRKLRLAALKRDQFICQAVDDLGCKKLGIMTPAKEVDHIIPFEGKDDPNRMKLDNLQSLCVPCHKRKTASQRKRNTMKITQSAPAVLKRKNLSFA